ncbi:MAG: hypothetical protein KJ634_14590 [Gammaproteobacteria bacterium]|nr:hypothetical protein [Gammaproteobacteria bacterium]MBU1416841.1 hypothetical protein [Gammaproteobacteria bacterium]
MVDSGIFLLSVFKALVDVALWSLLGQGVVGFLAGSRRDTNPVFQLLRVVASPAVRVVRIAMPKVILDRHVPFIAFFLLLWLSIALAWTRRLLVA